MKKIVLSILIVFSLGVFAASVDLSGAGSVAFNPQANEANQFVPGQTDITLKTANKDISFIYVLNLDDSGILFMPNAESRYAFVEGKILGGVGQAGLISPIVSAGMAPGFYGNSAFFTVAQMDGSGFSYATGPWTVAYTGAATILNDASQNEAGKLGVAYDAKDMGKYAIIMNQNKGTGTIVYDFLMEYGTAFGALNVSAQVMWGLQGATQKQYVALYATYMLDKAQSVYATYADDLAGAVLAKSLSLGYEYALSNSTKAIVNYTNSMPGEAVTVGLGFNI